MILLQSACRRRNPQKFRDLAYLECICRRMSLCGVCCVLLSCNHDLLTCRHFSIDEVELSENDFDRAQWYANLQEIALSPSRLLDEF
jgi:hypothetical protein